MRKSLVVAGILLSGSMLCASDYMSIAGDFLDTTVGLEFYNSTSHELVYYPYSSYKISELIYEADNAKLLNVGFRYKFHPEYIAKFKYKTLLQDGSNVVNDYDWFDNTKSDWTHWSNHPNTKLDKLSIIDLSVQKHFGDTKYLSHYLNLGYFKSNKTFKSYNGTYIYSSSRHRLRDLTGNFEGLGLTYKETITMPYVSLDNTMTQGKNSFNLNLRYSPSVNMKYSDTHHLREFTSIGTHKDSTMFGYQLDYKYEIDPKYTFGIGYTYAKYNETKGDEERTYFNGEVDNCYQCSAMKSKENSLNFYLEYKL